MGEKQMGTKQRDTLSSRMPISFGDTNVKYCQITKFEEKMYVLGQNNSPLEIITTSIGSET